MSCSTANIQRKIIGLDNSLQKIVSTNFTSFLSSTAFCFQRQWYLIYLIVLLQLKGQDNLKAHVESSTKSTADQLSVLNSQSNKLEEISSTLSVWMKQTERYKATAEWHLQNFHNRDGGTLKFLCYNSPVVFFYCNSPVVLIRIQ